MPPRTVTTARQRRLGTELRKMREAAGYNAREAAAILGIDHTKISQVETARFGVSADRVRTLAGAYKCDDQAYIDALVAMATNRTRGWWEEYRGVLHPGFLDVAELEHHSAYLRTYQIAHIPGIAQTEDYAHAVFKFGAPHRMSKKEAEARVGHRVQRAKILDRDSPFEYEALVHEAALRMRFGGRDVARAQLRRLLELTDRSNFTLRVVPFGSDGFAGSGQAVLYAGGPVPQLDTVHLDSMLEPVFLDAEEHLAIYRNMFSKMERRALSAKGSRDFIAGIIHDL
ncbi:helix-turn-helix transcriptional regulator [Streptomyces chitinivorans]|uniref:Helix-turn-helix transcriptional regulator n=1 Tax=Streptomyces chitinivorans TaxID=1257027 RepID=A0ABW7HPR6_9ACTN|nr:helix-turn-helix transcriptional regulator [Streptomyces chitinivorans]MDH2410636.1 helix-turn-helix transcriptional regulator [Streptomyces chitinivorans]